MPEPAGEEGRDEGSVELRSRVPPAVLGPLGGSGPRDLPSLQIVAASAFF